MASSGPEAVIPKDLLWRCRRGMRELDVLITRWVKMRAGRSSEAELDTFRGLLECEDDLLWDWMLGRGEPADADMRKLVREIRSLQSD